MIVYSLFSILIFSYFTIFYIWITLYRYKKTLLETISIKIKKKKKLISLYLSAMIILSIGIIFT